MIELSFLGIESEIEKFGGRSIKNFMHKKSHGKEMQFNLAAPAVYNLADF